MSKMSFKEVAEKGVNVFTNDSKQVWPEAAAWPVTDPVPEVVYQDCAICYESCYKANSITTSCKHTFHFKCLRKWLSEKDECPNCRTPHPDKSFKPTPAPAPVPRQMIMMMRVDGMIGFGIAVGPQAVPPTAQEVQDIFQGFFATAPRTPRLTEQEKAARPEQYVMNPRTGRYVLRTSEVGRNLTTN